MLRARTKKSFSTMNIYRLPRKFTIPKEHRPNIADIRMKHLASLANNSSITITIKVMEISAPETITTKAEKVIKCRIALLEMILVVVALFYGRKMLVGCLLVLVIKCLVLLLGVLIILFDNFASLTTHALIQS